MTQQYFASDGDESVLTKALPSLAKGGKSVEEDSLPLLPMDGDLVTIPVSEIKPLESNGYIFSGTKPLGIQYGMKGKKLILQDIYTGGSIEKWNERHSNDSKVRVGDEIVAIYDGTQRIDLRSLDEGEGKVKSSFLADRMFGGDSFSVTLELVRGDGKPRSESINGRPQAQHSDLGDRLVYKVSLGRPLGLRIDSKQTSTGTIVVVSKIAPSGAASRWNATTTVHAQRIRLGDRVLAFYDSQENRIDVSKWPGREIADRIHGIEGEAVTIEFERTANENDCCCCSIL